MLTQRLTHAETATAEGKTELQGLKDKIQELETKGTEEASTIKDLEKKL